MTIRSCSLDDLESVFLINKEIYGNDCYPKVVIRQFYDCFSDNIKIAIENKKIIGFSINGMTSNSNEGWILSLGVSEGFRHYGIGTKLLLKSIEELKKGGAKVIKLTAHPDNTGIRLYKKIGFKIKRKYKDYYGDNEERLLMSYSISDKILIQ